MAINAGNPACSSGLSKQIFDALTTPATGGDPPSGFSDPLGTSQTDALKFVAFKIAQGIAVTVNAGSVLVRDEGVDQGTVQTFDFVGAGISVSVAGGVATVTVTGGGGSYSAGDGLDLTGSVFSVEWGTGTLQVRHGDDAAYTNARTPTAHASTHVTGGGDTIADAVAGGASGLLSGTDKTKLNNTSGTNTGDQTITLTGDVTGTGTGSIAATIAALAVTAAKIANATITDTQVATANKDGAQATASMRTISTATPQALGTAAAGSGVTVASGNHVHAMPSLDQLVIPAADYAMNSHKLTGLAAGSAAGDSARWEQTPAGIFTTRGDNVVAGASAVPQRLALGAAGKFRRSDGTDDKWSTTTIPDTIASGSILRATAANVLSEIVYLGCAVQRFGSAAGEDGAWTGWALTSPANSTVSVASSKLSFVTTANVGASGASAVLTLTQDQWMAGLRIRFRISTFSPAAATTSHRVYGGSSPGFGLVNGDRSVTSGNIAGGHVTNTNVFDNAGAGWIETTVLNGVYTVYYGTGTTTTPPTTWKLLVTGVRSSFSTDGDSVNPVAQFFVQQAAVGTSTFGVDNCTVAPFGYGF